MVSTFDFENGIRAGLSYQLCVVGKTVSGASVGVRQFTEESCINAVTSKLLTFNIF